MLFLLRILFLPLTILRVILLFLNSLLFLGFVILENKRYQRTGIFNFWSAKYWSRINLLIMGVYVKHSKLPNISRYILTPNHSSYIDGFIVAAHSKSAFVAKAELLKWPIIGPAMKAGQAILVKRKEMKSLLETMTKIKAKIEKGYSVVVFPEGTTQKKPGTKPFKNGTFKIAADNNIQIIPCAIHFRNDKMKWVTSDTLPVHFYKQMWKPISFAEIRCAEPISNSDFKQLKEKTQQTVNEMLLEMEAKSRRQ
ncbi:MAG: lysophospholipid acyltransferase family protein [Prolixibacteraceae bacterium]|jgi:1-acyl-sn-glycerol-3-phosphate acyltransferase|nr:lysophospholipid acyltransferase family protein [Prolixibacteraceae bacterium]